MKKGLAVRIAVFVTLIVSLAGMLQAQVNQSREADRSRMTPGATLDKLLEQQSSQTGTRLPVLPIEEAIDPKKYIVGPNDLINVGIWGGTKLSYPIVVSPEGTLLVPELGEYQVGGKTLEDVKKFVIADIKRQFRVAEPTVTLISARQFIITVLGAVRNPGPYILSSAYRVDKAVALANLLTSQDATLATQPQAFAQIAKLPDMSRRRIIVRRKGLANDMMIDVERFFVSRRDEDNPFLREGDIVIVPPKNIDQGSVSVYGAVNNQNQFEYREYDSLWAMVRMAQGLTANADSTNVELTRLSLDGAHATSQTINMQEIINGNRPDLPLQPRDRIVVRQKTDRRLDYKAHVRGEVKYPGMYPITADSTRLSEMIERAGGFTEYAYLAGADLFRKRVNQEGEYVSVPQEALMNLRMNDQVVTPEERAYYDLEASIQRGAVSVDFVKLYNAKDKSQDVFIKDGDVIFIPNLNKTVYVYGQVGRPGYVSFQDGADVKFYIQRAGGYGEEADAGNTRVIKAKSRDWKHPSDTTIEPGDFVWVPKDVRYPFAYYMGLISQAASLVSVVLSITLIALQLSK